jgi:hypothetical protein
VSVPWRAAEPLAPGELARLRRRAIFDCCKWDPQVEDRPTIGSFPLILASDEWRRLAAAAESLAREARAAEEEIVRRPELHGSLALPGSVVRTLTRAAGAPARGMARIIRFDFHHTAEGWRISEANTDVPGGLNEASGLGELMAPHFPGAAPAGDTAGSYARAVVESLGDAPHIALAHATAYTDDRQVMTYVARRLVGLGARTSLVSPAHIRWRDGRARLEADWARHDVDGIVRFFPAEWLPNLPRRCGWRQYFGGGVTPISNPASALATQSKRFPLIWDALRTPLPTWRALLPETRDPRDVPWRESDEWVLKPALGRVGEGIGMRGITDPKELARIVGSVRWWPRHWVAQRRFTSTPLIVGAHVHHPCVGVYTVDERVAGAYGRLASRPLVDWRATDVAVLVERDSTGVGRAPASPPTDRRLERIA